jgi:hypothetical protein
VTGQGGTLDPTAVSDTIAAVFRQRDYDRTVIDSVWDRIWRWVGERIGEVVAAIRHSPATRWVVIAVLVSLVIAILGRAIYLGTMGDGSAARGRRGRRVAGSGDEWADAQRLAMAGNYTDAAHALYKALLNAIARRGDVGIHPSKTVGDYGRELRRRSSPAWSGYRDFARSYETVIYGLGFCDQARYDRLVALATPLVGNDA